MDIRSCIPSDKHDFAAIVRAREADFPAIVQILPELLAWMADMNWPVAPEICALLAGSGPEIVTPIRTAFSAGDDAWTAAILNALCPRLDRSVLWLLHPDFEELAGRSPESDPEGIGEAARALLTGRGLVG